MNLHSAQSLHVSSHDEIRFCLTFQDIAACKISDHFHNIWSQHEHPTRWFGKLVMLISNGMLEYLVHLCISSFSEYPEQL
jgi:hypothetical protein